MNKVICANCGKRTATAHSLSEYHYRESGLENVWLAGSGVVETKCSDCGGAFIRILKEQQLLQVIAMGLLMEPISLKGPELRFLRRACALSQSQLASMLECRRETIAEREAKAEPGLGFAEETGIRLILLKSFQGYLATPGNSCLAPSQFVKLWDFAGFFDRFATKVDSIHGRHRIKAALQQDLWTLKEDKRAA